MANGTGWTWTETGGYLYNGVAMPDGPTLPPAGGYFAATDPALIAAGLVPAPVPIPPTPTPIPAATPAAPTILTTPLSWPLDSIQSMVRELWNDIQAAWTWLLNEISNLLKPLFDTVWSWLISIATYIVSAVSSVITPIWDWIQGVIAPILAGVSSAVLQVWTWIDYAITTINSYVSTSMLQVYDWVYSGFAAQGSQISAWFSSLSGNFTALAADIGARVSAINTWFSAEFIDPFLDWLVKLPANLWTVFIDALRPAWAWIVRAFSKGTSENSFMHSALEGIILGMLAAITLGAGDLIIGVGRALGTAITSAWPAISGWLTGLFGNLGIWIVLYAQQLGTWALALLPRLAGWFTGNIISLLGSGAVLTAASTGKLEVLIDKYVSPAIVGVFDQFEALGPVSPMSGKGMSTSIGKLATFTVAGLAGMTLAGEMLSPLKQIGLGHIAAIVYDLINYKTLTAAFMGVLAFVYIKTPLTYYYQRAARPNLPDERGLAAMLEDRAITSAEYADNMAWQGYSNTWIAKIEHTLYRPMTPYMLRSLAEAGLLDDDLLEHSLNHAGYDDLSKVAIKQMMHTLAAGALGAVSTSTAMSRYQEGFDDETALRKNLSVLGVADSMLDRYVFAAQLKYLYDYQTDLKTYYIDAYHRRAIEEPELRSSLAATGFAPDRLDLVVQAQKIKRLAAAKAADNPALAVQFDTIRDRRKKALITHLQEIDQLVALGYELDYATAIADNDEVALAKSGVVPAPPVLLAYETETGKVEVDTIRRQIRARQIDSDTEFNLLRALEMPVDLAQAIVANDVLRMTKQAVGA